VIGEVAAQQRADSAREAKDAAEQPCKLAPLTRRKQIGDDRERGGGGILGLLLFFLAPLAAMLLQLGLSRQREFSADETGARMVGQPYGLMSALQKLGAYNQRIPTTSLSPSTSALCIVKPLFGGGTRSSLFSTHPPLEKRIQALREMTVTPER